MAFLGRYGHQDARQLLQMPVTLVAELAKEVGEILDQERSQFKTDSE